MTLRRLMLSAWLLLACGGDAELPDAGARDASERDANADVAKACASYFRAITRCDAYVAVLAVDLGWDPFAFYDRPQQELDRLEARFEPHCRAWLELPGVGFDADALAACGAAVEADGCDAMHASSCAFAGTLEVGQPCVLHEQCASGDCDGDVCERNGGCGACRALAKLDERCDGHCESRPPCESGLYCTDDDYCSTVGPPAAEGERCTFSGCEEGLYCSTAGSSFTCERLGEPADLGEPCSRAVPCAEPFECPPSSDMSGAAICEEAHRTPLGEPCGYDHECAEGLICSPRGTCEKRSFAEPGAPCDYDQAKGCRVGDCIQNEPDVPGRCPRVLAEGERCGESRDRCDHLAGCVDGRCTLAKYPTCEAALEDDAGRD